MNRPQTSVGQGLQDEASNEEDSVETQTTSVRKSEQGFHLKKRVEHRNDAFKKENGAHRHRHRWLYPKNEQDKMPRLALPSNYDNPGYHSATMESGRGLSLPTLSPTSSSNFPQHKFLVVYFPSFQSKTENAYYETIW
jgi:hypothetical protein